MQNPVPHTLAALDSRQSRSPHSRASQLKQPSGRPVPWRVSALPVQFQRGQRASLAAGVKPFPTEKIACTPGQNLTATPKRPILRFNPLHSPHALSSALLAALSDASAKRQCAPIRLATTCCCVCNTPEGLSRRPSASSSPRHGSTGCKATITIQLLLKADPLF